MQLTTEQALDQAVAAHNAGNLSQAERIYRAILKSQPGHPDANHNLGLIAVSMNQVEMALPLFKAAVDANPDFHQFWLSYVDALVKAGRSKAAKQAIKKAKKKGVDAKPLSKLAAQSKPRVGSNAQSHNNVGNTLLAEGSLGEAEASYRRAIALKADYAEAHYNLANTLYRLGRLSEAEASYNNAIEIKPDYVIAHNNLGSTLEALGRLDDAEACYQKAITLKPDYAVAHYNLANTLRDAGKLDEAEASYQTAVTIKPDYAVAHNNFGSVLFGQGRLDEAEARFSQAVALQPDYAEAHKNLGSVLKGLGRLSEAEASFNRAIALKPDYAEAYRHVTQLKKLDTQDDRFLKMLELYDLDSLSDEQRSHLNFGLAKVNEDLENFEQAFTHYVQGNALRKKSLNYQFNQDLELFRCIKSTHPLLEQCVLEPNNLAEPATPIFILGMPRSGTTLVEQIISSHPLVTGAGELPYVDLFGSALATGRSNMTQEALLNFRTNYLGKLNEHSVGKPWVTDKMPHNFRYLGLLTKALPEAKFIHVKRDPAAVCWGNFKTDFSANKLGYAWAIDDIVAYFELYQDLMAFWDNALQQRIYHLDYEQLTERQEPETRKLIDFIGIDWDDNCLAPEDNARRVSTASNLQVRQTVYTGSSEKWRKYEPFLKGAFDALEEPNPAL